MSKPKPVKKLRPCGCERPGCTITPRLGDTATSYGKRVYDTADCQKFGKNMGALRRQGQTEVAKDDPSDLLLWALQKRHPYGHREPTRDTIAWWDRPALGRRVVVVRFGMAD